MGLVAAFHKPALRVSPQGSYLTPHVRPFDVQVAYPGVSLKVLRVFKCRTIDSKSWLVADMRLQCYTSEWAAYAFYALLVGIFYVIGFPLGEFFRHP